MKKLRVGIIGLGVGQQHLDSYNEHSNCKVTAFCDFSDEKCIEIKERYPDAKITKNPLEIIEDPSIEVVSIASFDNYHYEQVMAALTSDKHIMVEKPLCLNSQEAENIRKLLDKKPELKLSSNLVLRTCPRFISIREAINSGKMGSIFYVEGDYLWGRIHKLTQGWRKDMDFYSIINGAAIHMIDLILWLIDMKPQEVTAFGNRIATANSSLRYNSFVAILMRFKDGCIAKVSANGGCIHPHFHRLTVFGTEKTAINDLGGAKWVEDSNPDILPSEITEAYPAKKKRCKVITSFIDSIINKEAKPIVAPDDVFNSMSVCFAVEESLRKLVPVRVNYI